MHLSRWALLDKSRLTIHQRDVSWAHYRSIETSSKSVKQSIVCNYFFVGGLSVNCIRISFLESTRSYCRPTSISRRNITPHLCSCTPGTSPRLLVSYTWNCREQVKEDLLVQIQKKTVLRSAWFFSTSWVGWLGLVYIWSTTIPISSLKLRVCFHFFRSQFSIERCPLWAIIQLPNHLSRLSIQQSWNRRRMQCWAEDIPCMPQRRRDHHHRIHSSQNIVVLAQFFSMDQIVFRLIFGIVLRGPVWFIIFGEAAGPLLLHILLLACRFHLAASVSVSPKSAYHHHRWCY